MESVLRNFRYYDFLMAGTVAVLLCSNLIGPAKACVVSLPILGVVTFGAGNLFFPISYIFGDVMTEVYGYARARRAIWAGFAAMLFATLMSAFIVAMPASPTSDYNKLLQPALETVFGNTWRIVVASMVAYWVGDFVNSLVMAKMKVWSEGRHLWMRTIGSTICGQGIDSLLFYPIAFYALLDNATLASLMTFNVLFKIGVEVAFTPVTYWVVNALKRAEGVDTYDRDISFSPFSLKDEGDTKSLK
ncbi:MAG: queuosine precursor transporter [Nevskia sp.]|nr:queuosine precursor transporter [Nevskia sp.]